MTAEVLFSLLGSAFFWFARARWGALPQRVSEAGMIGGIVLALWVLLAPPEMKPPAATILFAFAGILCFGAATHFYFKKPAEAQQGGKMTDDKSQRSPPPGAKGNFNLGPGTA